MLTKINFYSVTNFLILLLCACIFTQTNSVPVRLHPHKKYTCVYDNATYAAKEKFRPEPCTACTCPEKGGRPVCSIQDCQYQPNCLRFVKEPNACCGTCLEFGCLYNDNVFRAGDVILNDTCETCICPKTGNAKVVCAAKITCPAVICMDAIVKPGECCPYCPNGENCRLGAITMPAGRRVMKDKCTECQCPKEPEWPSGENKMEAICSPIDNCDINT